MSSHPSSHFISQISRKMWEKGSPPAGEGRRLAEALSTDLRALSSDAKKKHAPVRDAAESALGKVRSLASLADHVVLQQIGAHAGEILVPFVLASGTRNPKLVVTALGGIQKLIQFKVLDLNGAASVVNELWALMETECEELRVLQTAALLVTTGTLVGGPVLARCLVMCFRLHFAKDSTVINAASAAVRQLVNQVFERVATEDAAGQGRRCDAASVSAAAAGRQHHGRSVLSSPPSGASPAAGDAFMLFQDICLLVNAEKPRWLVGITEMTRTLGLELLEAALSQYSSVLKSHGECEWVLREHVCPLVIRLFSPSLKNVQIQSQHPASATSIDQGMGSPGNEPPYFPISMRLLRVVGVLLTQYNDMLVTECEIFLSLVLKFLDTDKLPWQRALALEILHKICNQPNLIRTYCMNYDMRAHSTKLLETMLTNLCNMVQISFTTSKNVKQNSHALDVDLPTGRTDSFGSDTSTGNGAGGQPGFVYRGVWVPLCQMVLNKANSRGYLLEMLDRLDAPRLHDGYCVSMAYSCLVDATHGLHTLLSAGAADETAAKLHEQLFDSMSLNLLTALSLLLDASVEENVTESLLKCVALLVRMACERRPAGTPAASVASEGPVAVRDASVAAVCKVALPANYLARVLAPTYSPRHSPDKTPLSVSSDDMLAVSQTQPDSQHQVVAVGTACPTPNMTSAMLNAQIMLTAKNVQSMRTLIGVAQTNGGALQDCWNLVLATLQHLVWMLGLRPALGGGFKSSESVADSGTVLTTAVMADVPVITAMLNKLFDTTRTIDVVALHHVIAALCKLSAESMEVCAKQDQQTGSPSSGAMNRQGGRPPSYFGVAKLAHVGQANVHRMATYWRALSTHLVEVCASRHAGLRQWGAVSMAELVKTAFAAENVEGLDAVGRHRMCVSALGALGTCDYEDVRHVQIECVTHIVQHWGQQIDQDLWVELITIVGSVVGSETRFSADVIKQAYHTLGLFIADFVQLLSAECIRHLVDVDFAFGDQKVDLNISLSAVGQLWTISDHLYRHCQPPSMVAPDADTLERLWLGVYDRLGLLCTDVRPAVRKSAGHTLLQTVCAHAAVLRPMACRRLVAEVAFPSIERVQFQYSTASTTKISTSTSNSNGKQSDANNSAAGAAVLMMHHSRDTESKQVWDCPQVKMVNALRGILTQLDDFPSMWRTLMQHVETAAASKNSEISLAALKSLHELIIGRAPTPQQLAGMSTANVKAEQQPPTQMAPLPVDVWVSTWRAWQTISLMVTGCHGATGTVGGPSHLTTLLAPFETLFGKVKAELKADDVTPLLKGLRGCASASPSADMAPFIVPTEQNVTPTQDAVVEAVKVLFNAMCTGSGAHLRSQLPAIFTLLCEFSTFACRPPHRNVPAKATAADWLMQNYVPFGELCTHLVVEFYSGVAHYAEIADGPTLTHIVNTLSLPLSLKYDCVAQSTWKNAVHAFITVLRIGLPIARRNRLFLLTAGRHPELWSEIARTLESFIFSRSKPPSPLSPDDRLRHEFIDCQMVDLISAEMLPHLSSLPGEFGDRLLGLLNDASIGASTKSNFDPVHAAMDASAAERAELASACFGALLALSTHQMTGPDVVRSAAGGAQGGAAVNCLVQRCDHVLQQYVVEHRAAAGAPLPATAVAQARSALTAVDAMLRAAVRSPPTTSGVASGADNSELKRALSTLYPTVVSCAAVADDRLKPAAIATLNAYVVLLPSKETP